MLEKFAEISARLLQPIFEPMNKAINLVDCWGLRAFCALGFFLGTMLWVGFILKNEEYVNIDRPNKKIWSDLRLWTVISMLPHVFVYLYFR